MMEERSLTYLYHSFAKLVEKHGFVKSRELNEGDYSIEYSSDVFVIMLQQYFREFYIILYKTGYPDNGVNLYNLFEYLSQDSPAALPKANYFSEEKDLSESYRKQFDYLTDVIDKNFAVINDFFKSADYDSKMVKIRDYLIETYPNLYKGWGRKGLFERKWMKIVIQIIIMGLGIKALAYGISTMLEETYIAMVLPSWVVVVSIYLLVHISLRVGRLIKRWVKSDWDQLTFASIVVIIIVGVYAIVRKIFT